VSYGIGLCLLMQSVFDTDGFGEIWQLSVKAVRTTAIKLK